MTHEILSNKQMAEADRKTIESGVSGYTLMQNAGTAVFKEIIKRYKMRPVFVLCGSGNNGGDGFVIAGLLMQAGWDVSVSCLVAKDQLKGDAFLAAQDWHGSCLDFNDLDISENCIVVDAVFGTGFHGSLKAPVSMVFKKLKLQGNVVIAVDIPSGVNGDIGQADPHMLKADMSVTFHRKKIGHVLGQGVEYSGDVVVREIGITDDFEYIALENHPDLWLEFFPRLEKESHKYKRGHAVIYGAPELTGATRLVAESCARVGAGLVSVLAVKEIADVYRETLKPHILVRDDLDWDDVRVTAKLYGSGGMSAQIDYTSKLPIVLDADALQPLSQKLFSNFVLTPHDGEFSRMFPDIAGGRIEKAQKAAQESGANIVLKGAETIIVSPDGRKVINLHASSVLATVGTGDVLAGMITGLMAQGMNPFDAACCAVWMHGECAIRFGLGLVASDILDIIPQVLKDLAKKALEFPAN